MVSRITLFLLSSLIATGAVAQTDLGEVRRLSPEEKERILANSSEAKADASLASIMGGGGSRPSGIHGEVGAMVGTNGARGVFGTALIPLGENGSAILSFEKSQFGDIDRRRR